MRNKYYFLNIFIHDEWVRIEIYQMSASRFLPLQLMKTHHTCSLEELGEIESWITESPRFVEIADK